MLSNEFKTEYVKVSRTCEMVLCRHPQRSMAEQLQSIMPLALQYQDGDTYGKGRLINDFEKEVATLLGLPDGIFLPSGTMAQTMALRIWADQKHCNRVAFHPTSHLQLHEQMGYQKLHGLEGVLVGKDEQVISCADLAVTDTNLAALLLELPMREIGGQLPSWDDLVAQSRWAKKYAIALHLDGARLWSCGSYYEKSLAEICSLFDSVYVSFYKDLDGIAGAMLLGTEAFIDTARIWSRRCGGNLVSQFPDILAAKTGFAKNLPLMNDFVSKTSKIAGFFNQQAQFQTIPLEPSNNMFHLVIQQASEQLMPKLKQWSEQNKIALLPLPRSGPDNSSRFEITIGQNALKYSDQQWQAAIESCARFIMRRSM